MGVQFYIDDRFCGGLSLFSYRELCHQLVERNGNAETGLEIWLDVKSQGGTSIPPAQCGELADLFFRLARAPTPEPEPAPLYIGQRTFKEWTQSIRYFARLMRKCHRKGRVFDIV